MNDPTYVEASRKLAERMMTEGGATADERIAFAFRLVVARRPRPAGGGGAQGNLRQATGRYRNDPAAAKKLLAVGESPRDEKLDAAGAGRVGDGRGRDPEPG